MKRIVSILSLVIVGILALCHLSFLEQSSSSWVASDWRVWKEENKGQKPSKPLRRHRIPLDVLTDSSHQNLVECPPNTQPVFDSPGKNYSTHKIPLVIHQTFKTRCVSDDFFQLTLEWKRLGIPYYFHDDAAIDRLVLSRFKEFPHLPLIWKHCIVKPVVKTDLWRMLLLYEYGGIYADLDTKPISFQPNSTIQPNDEMYTVTDNVGLPSFHFMAAMPHHPVPFLTLHQSLVALLTHHDLGLYNPAVLTGPGAIKTAMSRFLEGKPDEIAQIRGSSFTFHGKDGYTLRRDASMGNQIVLECAFIRDKVERFQALNVTHYSKTNFVLHNQSCFDVIMREHRDVDLDMGEPFLGESRY